MNNYLKYISKISIPSLIIYFLSSIALFLSSGEKGEILYYPQILENILHFIITYSKCIALISSLLVIILSLVKAKSIENSKKILITNIVVLLITVVLSGFFGILFTF